jgi:hypothetical protein
MRLPEADIPMISIPGENDDKINTGRLPPRSLPSLCKRRACSFCRCPEPQAGCRTQKSRKGRCIGLMIGFAELEPFLDRKRHELLMVLNEFSREESLP